MTSRTKSGWVYVLKAPDHLYKIGKTTRDPSERIKEFSPKLPFETSLFCAIPCKDVDWYETVIHEALEKQRVRGEWFRLEAIHLRYFREILAFQSRDRREIAQLINTPVQSEAGS